MDPVDHYRMAERNVRSAGLFMLLTFATVWLTEVLAGVQSHPIQYLMLGGALRLFYCSNPSRAARPNAGRSRKLRREWRQALDALASAGRVRE
jgi:hypothetical protein